MASMNGYQERFGGLARLYGAGGLERLRSAHVAVVGLGGVGSWVVEALARSGVGRLTLVDLDDVCISNSNRQLHAGVGQYGRPKVGVMTERVLTINPDCEVRPLTLFFTARTADAVLADQPAWVVDAIDRPSLKCLLIACCRDRRLGIVTVGGAGGRRDPTLIRTADLACSSHDPLLQEVRRGLRRDHGFPRGEVAFEIPCVYSTERPVFPDGAGGVCPQRPPAADLRLDCTSGYGTAAFVTGAFGLAAAGLVVGRIANPVLLTSSPGRGDGAPASSGLYPGPLSPRG